MIPIIESQSQYLVRAALNIPCPRKFQKINKRETLWGDFVWDMEKQEFVRILLGETNLSVKLFFLVIRPVIPSRYNIINPDSNYGWSDIYFQKGDWVIINWNEGLHKIDNNLIGTSALMIEPIILFRKIS